MPATWRPCARRPTRIRRRTCSAAASCPTGMAASRPGCTTWGLIASTRCRCRASTWGRSRAQSPRNRRFRAAATSFCARSGWAVSAASVPTWGQPGMTWAGPRMWNGCCARSRSGRISSMCPMRSSTTMWTPAGSPCRTSSRRPTSARPRPSCSTRSCKPPRYLYRKLAEYVFAARTAVGRARRRFYLVRTAATLGEFAGYRQSGKRGIPDHTVLAHQSDRNA
jgi:hypothetical protein